jgi:hypothetical protein
LANISFSTVISGYKHNPGPQQQGMRPPDNKLASHRRQGLRKGLDVRGANRRHGALESVIEAPTLYKKA